MKSVLITILFLMSAAANAVVKTAEVFSSNMVLQQEKNIRVWGTAEGGLTTSDGNAPTWFQYYNKTRERYEKGKAVIDGNKVIINVGEVKCPLVSFGFDEVAQPNLCNKAGLPAIPFEVKLQ